MSVAKAVVLVATLGFSSFVSAEWVAIVEDDIFSGKKKAMLGGKISISHMLVFDCDPQQLTFSVLQRDRHMESEDYSHSDLRIVVKVDQGKIHEFEGRASRRNENYVQTSTAEREKILDLLKEVRVAQSKIQIGLHQRMTDSRWSGTASVRGSTRETARFLRACELE